MTYNTLSNLQRIKKSDFFEKLHDDQYFKLQIERFYLQSKHIYVEQEMGKENNIKLIKNIMTTKKKSKKMLELIRLL